MDLDRHHARARQRGVNPFVYWTVRAILQPFFHVYFRLSRVGREHVPAEGPVIYAANHRSFLDPFVIGTMARRPIYYVAKEELFRNRFVAWLLNSLGAFPVRRGAADQDLLEATKEGRIDVGRLHPATLEIEAELEIAFDAVERPENDARHLPAPFLRTTGSTTG